MPVRIRIILLFVMLVFIIMSIVCGSVYYISSNERVSTIKKRLTNRAITTARLLRNPESFDPKLIRQIDSLTAISLKEKLVQVYDSTGQEIYHYSEMPGDSIQIDEQKLDEARIRQSFYFKSGNKEAVAYHYNKFNHNIVIISAANDQDGKASLIRLRNILLLSFILGIIAALIFGYFFSSKLLLPIKKISGDVSEISVQNLARRVSTGNIRDEWYSLANTFNQLLDKLQEGFELQRRFVSNASHELSTPLTSISNQLEVILEYDRTTDEYRRVIQSVYNDARHMGKLTQTLLEFATASGNKGGLDINLVRIDEILMNLPSELSRIDKNYSVVLDFEQLPEREERLLVYGNEALLLAAIKNIVINACKYSKEQEAIIHLRTDEKNLIIEVADRGIGIPPEEIGNIFQPFYRIEKDRVAGGFGLGLSMAERIIKLHRGSISVHSIIGEGTTFTIFLPSATNLG
jgi:two-component system sensor histidine kinase ArlS